MHDESFYITSWRLLSSCTVSSHCQVFVCVTIACLGQFALFGKRTLFIGIAYVLWNQTYKQTHIVRYWPTFTIFYTRTFLHAVIWPHVTLDPALSRFLTLSRVRDRRNSVGRQLEGMPVGDIKVCPDVYQEVGLIAMTYFSFSFLIIFYVVGSNSAYHSHEALTQNTCCLQIVAFGFSEIFARPSSTENFAFQWGFFLKWLVVAEEIHNLAVKIFHEENLQVQNWFISISKLLVKNIFLNNVSSNSTAHQIPTDLTKFMWIFLGI